MLAAALTLILRSIRILIDFVSDIVYRFIFEEQSQVKLPPITDDVLLQPAIDLAAKIHRQELSSVQVVSAFIARIKAVNGIINAVVDHRFDEALEEASRADEAIKEASEDPDKLRDLQRQRPFLGVPFTTKDCFAVKGLSYTAGLLARGQRKAKADFDADVVAQMRNAGGIPLGVTNVSELCMWMESANKVYGKTRNPYHIGRIPGGSSGGEGSNLASGCSPIGIGSDVGGSIRMPAFFNGIFGHKPSTGLVSNLGQLPVAQGEINDFLVTGPMSRYASDLMPLFKVMLRPNLPVNLRLDEPVDLKKLKIFYMVDDGGFPLISPVHEDLKIAQKKLIELWADRHGAKAVQLNLKRFFYSVLIWSNKMASEPKAPSFAKELMELKGEISAPWELLKWLCFKSSNHTLPAIGLALFEKAMNTNSTMHKDFLKMCDDLKAQLNEILGEDGVLIYPSHSTPAPYHGQALVKTLNFAYTAIFNVLGNPVTQVPLGLGSWGVPLGVQLVAALNQDRNCLAMALEVEKLFGGWVVP